MAATERMSARELRAAAGLAGIFGLRMFGLFAILPVFALYAGTLEGGSDLSLVGIALGAYGLAQALMQIPFGRWSDRVGRKPALYTGLAVFAAGSFVAGYSDSIYGVIAGRIVQGAGAISAVAIAMAADLTRDEHRTKAMAIIGSMIGVAFAASLVLGPWLNRHIGVPGIFTLIGVLALAAMAIVASLPAPEERSSSESPASIIFGDIFSDRELNRLNAGIFVLHAVLMSLFVTVPFDLVAAGMDSAGHWTIYAAVMFGALLYMAPCVYFGDRRGYRKTVFLGSIALVGTSQVMLMGLGRDVLGLGIALLVFFSGFMVLEAALPAQVSRAAPRGGRGAAIAVYSTAQFLGAFCGGALGGFLMQHFGRGSLFTVNTIMLVIWFVAATKMRIIGNLRASNHPIPPIDRDQVI